MQTMTTAAGQHLSGAVTKGKKEKSNNEQLPLDGGAMALVVRRSQQNNNKMLHFAEMQIAVKL